MIDLGNVNSISVIIDNLNAIFHGVDLKTAQVYFLLFIIYSFGGFLIEEVHCSIIEKKIVSRGFLIGPILPIYGTGAVIMTFFLTRYAADPLLLFCMAILSCGIVEYLASYIMEKVFNARWWDYSNSKFNLNGRVCLATIIPFGVFGLIIIYISNPIFVPFLEDFCNNNPLCFNIVTWTLVAITILDTIMSLILMMKIKNTATQISSENKKDNTDEITEKVKAQIRKEFMGDRLINAFPQLKTFGTKVKEAANKVVEKQGTVIEKKKEAAIAAAQKQKEAAIAIAKKQKEKASNIVKKNKNNINHTENKD